MLMIVYSFQCRVVPKWVILLKEQASSFLLSNYVLHCVSFYYFSSFQVAMPSQPVQTMQHVDFLTFGLIRKLACFLTTTLSAE